MKAQILKLKARFALLKERERVFLTLNPSYRQSLCFLHDEIKRGLEDITREINFLRETEANGESK